MELSDLWLLRNCIERMFGKPLNIQWFRFHTLTCPWVYNHFKVKGHLDQDIERTFAFNLSLGRTDHPDRVLWTLQQIIEKY